MYFIDMYKCSIVKCAHYWGLGACPSQENFGSKIGSGLKSHELNLATAKLVITFEAFKCLPNSNALILIAPHHPCRGNSA